MQDVTSFSFSSSAMDDGRRRHIFIGWPRSFQIVGTGVSGYIRTLSACCEAP
jgi:hypothetical protein